MESLRIPYEPADSLRGQCVPGETKASIYGSCEGRKQKRYYIFVSTKCTAELFQYSL